MTLRGREKIVDDLICGKGAILLLSESYIHCKGTGRVASFPSLGPVLARESSIGPREKGGEKIVSFYFFRGKGGGRRGAP